MKPLSRRRRQNLRELLALLLQSSGDQRGDLIGAILAQMAPERGKEPSLRGMRTFSAAIMEQLVAILRADTRTGPGDLLRFFKYLDHFPLEPVVETNTALNLAFPEGHGEDERELFSRLQLFWLLTQMGDYACWRSLRKELEPQVSLARPRLNAIYLLSLARILQRSGKRIRFCFLWLELICEYYRRDGSQTALYLILRWIRMINWGRDTALRKKVLQKYGARLRQRRDLLSATLLCELFNQQQDLAQPGEKMLYARLLLRHPSSLLTAAQLQYVHFFAGTYLSEVKSSFPLSIREYKHSNYYLHKTWSYLQNLSHFLRDNLSADDFSHVMAHLQQQVVDLGSQISLQNNAYVETLHKNYSTIKSLLGQVEQLSITDNLTGLRNRRYMANNLEHAFQLAARHKVPVCLAILDIDFFKQVNDAHGHLAGDHVLKGLAKMLLAFFRRSDVVIRYGGDEFMLILFDVSPGRMDQLMEELRRKARDQLFTWQGKGIRITLSIGWTVSDQATLSPAKLNEYIARIDAALYSAKKTGRDQVVRASE